MLKAIFQKLNGYPLTIFSIIELSSTGRLSKGADYLNNLMIFISRRGLEKKQNGNKYYRFIR